MNLDPRTIIIMNIIGSLIMGISLFTVSRGHLGQIRVITKWAFATLLQSFGWLVLGGLRGVVPDLISVVIGNTSLLLSIVFYFHIVKEFKNKTPLTPLTYSLVGVEAILLTYFLLISPNVAARIAAISGCTALVMFMSSYELLFDREVYPFSHKLTGGMFFICALILTFRCVNSLVWDTDPNQLPFGPHPMQNLSYLTFFLTSVMLTFGFVLMCIDKYIIDQKKMANELLNAKHIAEESAKQKEIFLANMSHEIRTPMNAIVGFTRLLQDTNLTEEQKKWLKTIALSGENLLVIINDILDFSKLEADKLEFQENQIDIVNVVSSTITILKPGADEKKIGLFFSLEKEIPPVVLGDKVRLTQILLNLVSNAIKFTNRGQVDVTANLVNETDEKVTIRFSVTDSGIGIEEEKLGAVFESFRQASGDTTRKYGGTGLGLTITKKLVELQGGSITVQSKYKEGSCFTFTLSFLKTKLDVQQTEFKTKELNHTSVTNLNVLVVEDNPVNQELEKIILEKWEINVDIAYNGKIAINKLNNKNYDLILMDIQMPELDGYETTKYIRTHLHKQTPIIAMTAHAIKDEANKCISIGMNDYISKPFDPKELLSKLIQHSKKAAIIKSISSQPLTNEKKSDTNSEEDVETMTKANLDYLKEITSGNNEQLLKILGIFIMNVPVQLKSLADSEKDKDWAELKAVSHKLISSVKVMDLKECEQTLRIIETAAIKKTNSELSIEEEYLLTGKINDVTKKCSSVIEALKMEIKKLSNS